MPAPTSPRPALPARRAAAPRRSATPRRRDRGGLSLIELVVVTGMIAGLLAIAAYQLLGPGGVNETAQRATIGQTLLDLAADARALAAADPDSANPALHLADAADGLPVAPAGNPDDEVGQLVLFGRYAHLTQYGICRMLVLDPSGGPAALADDCTEAPDLDAAAAADGTVTLTAWQVPNVDPGTVADYVLFRDDDGDGAYALAEQVTTFAHDPAQPVRTVVDAAAPAGASATYYLLAHDAVAAEVSRSDAATVVVTDGPAAYAPVSNLQVATPAGGGVDVTWDMPVTAAALVREYVVRVDGVEVVRLLANDTRRYVDDTLPAATYTVTVEAVYDDPDGGADLVHGDSRTVTTL